MLRGQDRKAHLHHPVGVGPGMGSLGPLSAIDFEQRVLIAYGQSDSVYKRGDDTSVLPVSPRHHGEMRNTSGRGISQNKNVLLYC